MRKLVASGPRTRALPPSLSVLFAPLLSLRFLLSLSLSLPPSFFFDLHPQPEWMLMDASAITSEPRDLTPSNGYGCNLLHLRSAFGPTPSKRLHRERSERVSRLVASLGGSISLPENEETGFAATAMSVAL